MRGSESPAFLALLAGILAGCGAHAKAGAGADAAEEPRDGGVADGTGEVAVAADGAARDANEDDGPADSSAVDAPATAAALQALPARLVFSAMLGSNRPPQVLTVENHGPPVTLGAASVSGPNAGVFMVVDSPASQALAAGSAAMWKVQFGPHLAGVWRATLEIATSGTAPALSVPLSALATGNGAEAEPPLGNIFQALGYDIRTGTSGLSLGLDAGLKGDEVTAQRFVRAGPAPVRLRPVARYSPDEPIPFGTYAAGAGGPALRPLGTLASGHAQELNPPVDGGGKDSFDPGAAPFGLYTTSARNKLTLHTEDKLNPPPITHRTRTFPVKDALTGQAIPDAFVIGFEEASNGDYNDYVFLLEGARPAP